MKSLRDRTAVVVYLVLLWAVSLGVLGLAIPLYAASIGVSAARWGLLSEAFAVGLLVAEPIRGWTLDRLGVVAPFIVSRLLSTTLVLVLTLTSEVWVLVVAQAGRGAAAVARGLVGRK